MQSPTTPTTHPLPYFPGLHSRLKSHWQREQHQTTPPQAFGLGRHFVNSHQRDCTRQITNRLCQRNSCPPDGSWTEWTVLPLWSYQLFSSPLLPMLLATTSLILPINRFNHCLSSWPKARASLLTTFCPSYVRPTSFTPIRELITPARSAFELHCCKQIARNGVQKQIRSNSYTIIMNVQLMS